MWKERTNAISWSLGPSVFAPDSRHILAEILIPLPQSVTNTLRVEELSGRLNIFFVAINVIVSKLAILPAWEYPP